MKKINKIKRRGNNLLEHVRLLEGDYGRIVDLTALFVLQAFLIFQTWTKCTLYCLFLKGVKSAGTIY